MSKEEQNIKPLCELNKWNANAFTCWDIPTDECHICRNHIMDDCVDCKEQDDINNECKVVTGKCNCSFHYHCIQKWITTNNICPICINTNWSYQMQNKGFSYK